MKNKGFSLIELIVAMAVGSIVLLMVSVMLVRGTSMFRTENDEVNMRNDYQIIRNQLDQTLMEAKTVIVEEQDDYIIIYTGEIDTTTADRNFTTTSQTTEKVITYKKPNGNEKGRIYISGSYDSHLLEGNLITDMVQAFDISLDETSKRIEKDDLGNDVIYYANPVKINISLGIANKKSDVNYDYTINLRNRLKEIVFYRTENDGIILSAESDVVRYKVK